MTSLPEKLLQICRDTYKIGYEEYDEYRKEARDVIQMYGNRQYTAKQIEVLTSRGQPIETFNVIKLMTHALLGYFETVVNDIEVLPKHPSISESALAMNDTVSSILEDIKWEYLNLKLKMDMMWTGYSVFYERVIETGERDEFGRKLYKIEGQHVPALSVVLDPASTLEDYSDARFIHH